MNPLVVFESLRPTQEEHAHFLMRNPQEVLECHRLEEVEPTLKRASQLAAKGLTVAGFLSYEAGFAFLPHMPKPRASFLPLAWFAVTDELSMVPTFSQEPGELHFPNLRLDTDFEAYENAILNIKSRIEKGDTYQVNYTIRYRSDFKEDPMRLYQALRVKQRVNYAALIQTDDWAIVSLSPELFFRKQNRDIRMRPMKGTAPRGRTFAEDQSRAEALRSDPKEVSENLMIVDMLRNDLGKICEPGSITVTDPMRVERYETLLQMTTGMEGVLQERCEIPDIFRATFPSGSITGAPKVNTAKIIDSLETSARGVYTGAIGLMRGNDAVFSVAQWPTQPMPT